MARLLAIVVTACTLALIAAPAQARTTDHPIKCRNGYVRKRVRVHVREHHRLVWVKRWRCTRKKPTPPVTITPTVRYAAVDPSFTQSAVDPLAVSYAYSASATSTTGAVTTNLAATGQLPAGVLDLFSATSPGQPAGLVCSINVGGTVTGGNCLVAYQQTGTYQVVTEYIPNGVTAVTQTDLETISAYSTTTTESASVAGNGCNAPVKVDPSMSTYSCDYTLSASTTDQNGSPVTQPITFTFSDGVSPGDNLTVTLPTGQGSCSVVIYETTATGNEMTGGASASSSSAIVPSTPCTGGGGTVPPGPPPTGRAVPAWTVVASFGGTPAFTASSSGPETVSPPW